MRKCLDSVIREEPKEVIAVDAMSNDGTIDILDQYGARIIPDPLGPIGHARQIGVDAATGDYVMFVDSDVELGVLCLQTMVRDLIANNWVGVHAVLLSAENASYWQKAENDDYLNYYHPGPIKRIDTIAALFKRNILLNFPFDRRLVAAEDVDLSRRLILAGYGLGVSTAIAYHTHRREFSAFAKQRYRNGVGSAQLGMKYGTRNTRTLLTPFLSALSHTIRAPMRGQVDLIPYRLAQAPIIFAGVLMGLSRIGFSRANWEALS